VGARRLLVTRPAEQAGPWVQRLREAGIDAAALPLLGVAPVDDAAPVVQAWGALAARDLLVFVSPNAVAQFFARRPAHAPWPAALTAAAPGPGTAAALRAAGVARVVEPAADAASFDSEALWQQLAPLGPWDGRSVLVLRGGSAAAEAGGSEGEGEGRDWLIRTLREAGARVEALAVYRRGPPQWGADEQALWTQALAAPDRHVWWFSSSEALGHLPPTPPQAWHGAVALASHPRIAAAARHAGFDDVREVAPVFESLRAALASLGG
jgi:uroporphyrinogen-III synthase